MMIQELGADAGADTERFSMSLDQKDRGLGTRASARSAISGAAVTLTLAFLSQVALGVSDATAAPVQAPVRVVALRTEYKENPLGIDSRKPRLSWQLQASGRGVVQSAYQVRVAASEGALRSGSPLLWDSGRVASDESIQRTYDGPALRTRVATPGGTTERGLIALEEHGLRDVARAAVDAVVEATR